MKNYLIAFCLSVAASTAFAQATVNLPADPTIPSMRVISPNASAALASSTTNSVFIDQAGDNPNVNITQQGSGNKLGSAGRPVHLEGIDQTVVTRQIGSNNTIDLEVVNAMTGDGQGSTVTIQQVGNSNIVDASCGYGKASDGTTELTGCKSADINWKLTGNSNVLQFKGTGDSLKSAIDVSGNVNTLYIDAIGNNHSQTLKVIGDYNAFNINQRSTGVHGSSLQLELTGTSNNVAVSQTGNVDGVLSIKSVSNNGTINIVQTSGSN